MLNNNYIFAENVVKFVKNYDVNVFDEKTAWMMKNNNINTFNKKMISAFNKQVNKILKIDKSFNFCCLQQELEIEDSEQSVFLTCNE